MVNLTLAIGDFMLLLVTAVAWTAAGFAGVALLGAGAMALLVHELRRRRS